MKQPRERKEAELENRKTLIEKIHVGSRASLE